MHWYQDEEYEDEEEDLMFSPALLARRASESWIVAPPIEVFIHSMLLFLIRFNRKIKLKFQLVPKRRKYCNVDD